jgi:hypothetical protein
MPDKDSLVGLQKMAANASNTATKHILQSSLYLTLRICENISRRVADSLNFPLTANSLMQSISVSSVETLKELQNLNLHDFGIYLELEPDDEEQAKLEANIQMALQSGGIDLEDAIDLRQIKNIKLANQSLKYKRKKKMDRDQANQQANIQAQAQANAQLAEQTAMSEVQKQQAITEQKIQLEQYKSNFEIQRLQQEAQIKKQLMAEEFNYNMQLAQMQLQQQEGKLNMLEDRKDKRTKIQATQASELIEQRQNKTLPKDFESAGFDTLDGFGLEQFEPK